MRKVMAGAVALIAGVVTSVLLGGAAAGPDPSQQPTTEARQPEPAVQALRPETQRVIAATLLLVIAQARGHY